MNKWKKFSLHKKITLSLLMLLLALSTPILALYMPEILIIIDFGGLELAVSYILLYFKSIISKFNQFLKSIKTALQIIHSSFENSLLINSNEYIQHQALSVLVMFVSGSIVWSLFVFVPALYLGGVNSII
jgi:hypothetical protein